MKDKFELKGKIKELYKDLSSEVESYNRDKYRFVKIANDIQGLAEEYSKLDDSFDIAHLHHTCDKEVSYVGDYVTNKSPKANGGSLYHFMKKAQEQIGLDIYSILH